MVKTATDPGFKIDLTQQSSERSAQGKFIEVAFLLAAYIDEPRKVQHENRGQLRQILYGFKGYVKDNAGAICKEMMTDPNGSDLIKRYGKILNLLEKSRNRGIAKEIQNTIQDELTKFDPSLLNITEMITKLPPGNPIISAHGLGLRHIWFQGDNNNNNNNPLALRASSDGNRDQRGKLPPADLLNLVGEAFEKNTDPRAIDIGAYIGPDGEFHKK